MSSSAWRILIGILVGAHGIGHVLFLVTTLGLADWGQSTHSWLLSSTIGNTAARFVGTIFWLAAIAGFLAAAAGIWGQLDWWRTVAIVSAVISALGLILFWSGGSSPGVSALVFDGVILVALVLFHWPPATLIGA